MSVNACPGPKRGVASAATSSSRRLYLERYPAGYSLTELQTRCNAAEK